MKRVLSVVCAALLVALCLASCGHQHEWEEATCAAPKTCKTCGETEGEPLGHKWTEATCTEPKTCSVCGETEGTSAGHQVNEADWKVIKEPTCTEQGKKEGVCQKCGKTVSTAMQTKEHTLGDWEITSAPSLSTGTGTRVKKCTVCGQTIQSEKYQPTDEELEAAYKNACGSYSYQEISRNPDDYDGTHVKFTGKIIQVLEDGNTVQLRVNVTQGRYGIWDDTIFVTYTRKDGEARLLEDDIITLYGISGGLVTYESIFGASITIPKVGAMYIDVN